MSNKKNKPLMPKLRFPAFRNSPEWISEKVDRLVDTITPPKKLPTSSYAVNGDFPIIDQSQNAICGWTDDREALIKDDLPLIIFGDHTCILKLLDRPFAQGADGIKILKPRPRIGTSYLYQYLSYRPVVTEEYKRHYSILKEKVVLFPDFKTGEQQKIADCLSSLDELIVAQARKVNALKTHKKGLMQQLFPREGETQPCLRFPEFQNSEAWTSTKLGQLGESKNNRRVPITAGDREPGNVPYYGASGIVDYVKDFIFDEDLLCISEDGANLVARTSPIAFPIAGKTWVNNHAHVLKFEHACTQKFVEVYLNSIKLDDYITGMAQPKLNKAMLDSIPIPHPSIPEQKRIADCLTALETLITATTQALETLKTHKKGLMQQLFPSAEAVEA